MPSMETAGALIIFATLAVFAGLWFRGERDAHGSAGWASTARSLLLPCSSQIPPGSFILSDSKPERAVLPFAESMRHGIIVGGSGTGKSRGYFIPNAAHARGTSLLCTDPKSELWDLTSGFHERAIRFAPTEPGASECFNWIPLCGDPRIAELCARAVVESGNTQSTDQAWIDTETAFLSGVFAHASTLAEPTPLSAYRLFTRQGIEALIEELMGSTSEAAREQATVFSQTQERMRGSIVPVVAAKLQFLRDPAVARFTSSSLKPTRLGSIKREPTAVYWCLRENDIARLRPLTSLFFSLLLEQLGAEESGDVPTLMLLDEFANIGTIPNFETTISLARGRGVSIWLGVQSLGQLEARYGKANARTIVSNCATKIALAGLDVESAEYFSRALGERTVTKRKLSTHLSTPVSILGSYTSTRTEHSRALLTPDEVRRIGADEAIAIVSNRRPMLLSKGFYSAGSFRAPAPCLGNAQAATVERQSAQPPPFPEELSVSGGRRMSKSLKRSPAKLRVA